MMKTKWDSDVTDHTSVVYVKNVTKLSRSIGLGVVCEKKKKQDNDATNQISVVYAKNKLSCHDQLDQMQYVRKNR